jgi:ABC-type amino acid transport substrate-binding protein
MVKKTRLILIVLIFTLLSVDGYSKTIKIGCVEDYYPYITVTKSGELGGILIDWWKLWSKKTGIDIKFIPLDLQSCIEKTERGEIDLIAGLLYSDARAEKLDFSETLIRTRTVLYLKNSVKVDSVKNLKVPINLVENNLAHSFLKENYPELELITLKTYASLMNAIHLQSVDAFTYDIPSLLGNYKQPAPPSGYYVLESLFSERMRPAVKKGNSEMLSLIVAGIAKISDEELIDIVERWKLFSKDRSNLYLILGVGFVLVLIIIVLLIRGVKSKRRIKLMADFEAKTDWQMIVEKGENDLIEFKSSLRWDYRQEKVNKALESVITKTISAFLNTEGGMLFIGIDDDGNAIGLENDYKTLSKKNRDGFMLALTNLINQDLGKSSHLFLSINIISLNDKDVCIVSVEKSDKPVFCGKNEKEEFYIRASASSQPLGMRESYKYIKSHWGSSQ